MTTIVHNNKMPIELNKLQLNQYVLCISDKKDWKKSKIWWDQDSYLNIYHQPGHRIQNVDKQWGWCRVCFVFLIKLNLLNFTTIIKMLFFSVTKKNNRLGLNSTGW